MKKEILILASALTLSAAAQADIGGENKLYGGIAFGTVSSDLDAREAFIGAGHDEDVQIKSSDDDAYKIFMGYQINTFFAIEAGYQNYGKTDFYGYQEGLVNDLPVLIGDSSLETFANQDTDAFFLGVKGSFPLNDVFAITGSVGANFWDAKTNLNSTYKYYHDVVIGPLSEDSPPEDVTPPIESVTSYNDSNDGVDPYYSVGVSATVGDFVYGLEYAITDINDTQFKTTQLSLAYKF